MRTVIRSAPANEIDAATRTWGFLCRQYDPSLVIIGSQIQLEYTLCVPGIGRNRRRNLGRHHLSPPSLPALPRSLITIAGAFKKQTLEAAVAPHLGAEVHPRGGGALLPLGDDGDVRSGRGGRRFCRRRCGRRPKGERAGARRKIRDVSADTRGSVGARCPFFYGRGKAFAGCGIGWRGHRSINLGDPRPLEMGGKAAGGGGGSGRRGRSG